MNSKQLEEIIKSDYHVRKLYRGCFASNHIKRCKKKFTVKTFIIINTAESNHKGLHWLTCFRMPNEDSSNIYEVFDSLGRPQSCISKYFPFKGEIEYTSTQLQLNSSSSCGLFCLAFIFHRILCMDWTFSEVVNDLFSRNLKKNELTVKTFYIKKRKEIQEK